MQCRLHIQKKPASVVLAVVVFVLPVCFAGCCFGLPEGEPPAGKITVNEFSTVRSAGGIKNDLITVLQLYCAGGVCAVECENQVLAAVMATAVYEAGCGNNTRGKADFLLKAEKCAGNGEYHFTLRSGDAAPVWFRTVIYQDR